MAQGNLAEDKRHLLKQPYLRYVELQHPQPKKAPYRTKEETLDYIFEGL